MVGKRKANSMMNQIAKIAKQIDEATEDAQKEAKPMTDEGWEKESKGEPVEIATFTSAISLQKRKI